MNKWHIHRTLQYARALDTLHEFGFAQAVSPDLTLQGTYQVSQRLHQASQIMPLGKVGVDFQTYIHLHRRTHGWRYRFSLWSIRPRTPLRPQPKNDVFETKLLTSTVWKCLPCLCHPLQLQHGIPLCLLLLLAYLLNGLITKARTLFGRQIGFFPR